MKRKKSSNAKGRTPLSSQAIFNAPSSKTASLPIHSILPDPNQAREFLPSEDVKSQLYTGTSPLEIMDMLLQMGDHNPLNSVISLAETIKNAGLIQPISVRHKSSTDLAELPAHVTHIITTGERRWWAHVYLTATNQKILNNEAPTHIAVTYTPDDANVVLQQLLENFQREDLNAAERAFGLIQLKDELEKENQRKVRWEEVYESLGIARRYGIYLRKVNDLSLLAIEKIKKHGFKEGSIRPISTKLKDFPDYQIVALDHLLKLQQAENRDLMSLDQFIDDLLTNLKPNLQQTKQKPRISKTINLKSLNKGLGKITEDLSKVDLPSLTQKDRKPLIESLEKLIDEAQEKLNSINSQ